jgi:hypothetical protein
MIQHTSTWMKGAHFSMQNDAFSTCKTAVFDVEKKQLKEKTRAK